MTKGQREEMKRHWEEKAKRAREKMEKAKGKRTVKKWALELQVTRMMLRGIEKEEGRRDK